MEPARLWSDRQKIVTSRRPEVILLLSWERLEANSALNPRQDTKSSDPARMWRNGIRARLRDVWLCLASSSLAIRIFNITYMDYPQV